MRVAVGHDQLGNPNNDGAFVEIGWIKAPGVYGNGRFVYAAWQPTVGSYDNKIILKLATGDWSAHDYRVAVKNDNQTQWSFMFDGTVKHTIAPGFSRGSEVGCGGEADNSQNAIGAAACWNVRYKNNNLTSWVWLPSHLKRVSSGYQVYDYSTYSWQSSGNN